jgi:hypothetical protein
VYIFTSSMKLLSKTLMVLVSHHCILFSLLSFVFSLQLQRGKTLQAHIFGSDPFDAGRILWLIRHAYGIGSVLMA